MKRFLATVLFASLALAGCGSATDGIDFKAPAGWTAVPSFLFFGHMQMWVKKAPDKKLDEMLAIVRGQTTTTMDLKALPQTAGMGVIRTRKYATITICGHQRAQYFSSVASGRTGQTQVMEMLSAPVGAQSYLALYVRPQSEPADPEAETAIRSLCAAKT